ncbi:3-oxoacyl-ACP reductase [Blastococcus deserti]|uniref:3-oxoacyl-ACP reductase n=1 Tax=Blastococcus deserti TaxID=2259033 RepID=A0ABW4XHD2_9ACTN
MVRRLVGRVAVVTGGGSGIGLASVRRLAAEGAHVVVGDVDPEAGKTAADEVGGLFVQVDVTSPEQVDALFQAAVDTFGGLDVAFNNAGISPPDDDSILVTGLDAWRRVQEVNLTSVYLCCKAAIPHMQARGRGSIINTASFVARMGAATSQISYTASKGGVLAMSRELGVQFAREGIRVNALSPGPVNTPLLQELFAKDPERAARRLVHIPMGRFAEADEIAAAVAFLASDDSSFITASEFLVDGGISGAYVTPV